MTTRPSKPLNLWLYVLMSIPPFICLYPLRKLKKIRLMLLINLAITGGTFGVFYLISLTGYQFHNGPSLISSAVLIVVQCILVYGWVKKHNKSLIQT